MTCLPASKLRTLKDIIKILKKEKAEWIKI